MNAGADWSAPGLIGNKPMVASLFLPALLALQAAAAAAPAACAKGSRAIGGRCYRVTTETASHRGCVELCGSGASLACIRSEEENAQLSALIVDTVKHKLVWLGNYQLPGSKEPAGGWSACPSGEATNFTYWANELPLDYYGAGASCAMILPGRRWDAQTKGDGQDDRWYDAMCFNQHRCLCELGLDPSPAYLAFVEADIAAGLEPYRADARLMLLIVLALWSLPLLYVLVRNLVARAMRRAFPPQPTPDAPARVGPSDRENATVATLARAEAAAARRRARVSNATFQLGWMLLILTIMPLAFLHLFGKDKSFMTTMEIVLGPILGNGISFVIALPWGISLLLLTVRHVDTVAIRGVGCGIMCAFLLSGYFFLAYVGRGRNTVGGVINSALVVLFFFSATALTPLLVCDGCGCDSDARWRMPPRLMLRWLWRLLRLVFAGVAISFLADLWLDPYNSETKEIKREGLFTASWLLLMYGAYMASSLIVAISSSFLLAALIVTPANRGRVLRALDQLLNPHETKEQEAAVLASLLSGGGVGVAHALRMAQEKFVVLPLSRLDARDLDLKEHNEHYLQAEHEVLNRPITSRTEHAALGHCDAFISHSWQDDGDKKFARLHEHAWDGGSSEPTIWLDVRAHNLT